MRTQHRAADAPAEAEAGASPAENSFVHAHLRAPACLEPLSADAGVRDGSAASLALMPDIVRLASSTGCEMIQCCTDEVTTVDTVAVAVYL